jgi:hypothetical protein
MKIVQIYTKDGRLRCLWHDIYRALGFIAIRSIYSPRLDAVLEVQIFEETE